MEFHEVASLFPMMSEQERIELAEDIKKNGQIEPIWTYQGKIIDGRNRYLACQKLGIQPKVRTWAGGESLISFVVSLNLKRRHLNQGQKSAIALESLPFFEAEAQERKRKLGRQAALKQQEKPQTPVSQKRVQELIPEPSSNKSPLPQKETPRPQARDAAGSAFGVSGRYISEAKSVKEKAPELFEKVKTGEVSLAAASKKLDLEEKRRGIEQQAQSVLIKPSVIETHWRDWLPSQSPCDLLLTDPPYSTDMPDIAAFAAEWLPVALGKVKPTGRAYVCVGAYPDELQAYLAADRAGMTLAQVLAWTYRNTMGPSPAYDYKQNWQAILYFRGPEARPLDCPLMNEQFSVQDINAPDGRLGDRYHTWQKPDALAERLIRHSTKKGDLVLDPFAGTGTFLLAANRLGRVGQGCEIDPQMLEIAITRGCARA